MAGRLHHVIQINGPLAARYSLLSFYTSTNSGCQAQRSCSNVEGLCFKAGLQEETQRIGPEVPHTQYLTKTRAERGIGVKPFHC